MKTFLERLLDYYQLNEDDYKKLIAPVSVDSFLAGRKFDNIEKIVEFVKSFVTNNKKIIVYGDYDADGIMATSIIVKMFQYIGYEIYSYIPNRYQDGYGINLENAKKIVEDGFDLVITVDNGISAFEPIDYLKANNVSVVVFDHHEMQGSIPNCDYFMHPTLSNYGEVASSGAFTSFMFSVAFLGRFDKYLSILASISLISDMMPLKEYNRELLRLAISSYKEGEFLPIDLLKEQDTFNEVTIGMKIAPKINSVGRLIDSTLINQIIPFFVSNDKEKVMDCLTWINDCNFERKELSKNVIDVDSFKDTNEPAFVLKVDEKEGIIGLISNFLTSKYKKPSIVFTKDATGNSYKGSCRAPEGFNVVEAFDALKDYLITFGGHALAGGCSIEADKFDEFKEKFNQYVSEHPLVKVEKETIPLLIRELTFENLEIIKSFSPFGEGMKAPLFTLPRIKTNSLTFSKDQKHILTQIGMSTKLVGFNLPKEKVLAYDFVDLIGTMRKSEYRGFISLEFNISDFEQSNK